MSHERPEESPTEPQGPPPARRLLRSRDDRMIGGVAGGLATMLGVDVWVVRLAFLLTAFFGGAGVVAYLVALAFVPEDRGDGQPAETPPLDGSRVLRLVGLAALGIAAVAILDGGFGWGFGWFFGPWLLAAGVLAALAYAAYRGLERDGDRPAAARVAGAVLLAIAVLALALVGAAGAFWVAATGGGEAAAGVVVALGVVAAVSAFLRPARWLAPVALVIALPVAVVAAADIDVDGGIGERTYRPLTVGELRSGGYELGAGELVLDLRRLEWPRAGVVRTRVEMGMGHALVLVPEGVCVRAHGDIGAGAMDLFDEESGGIDVEQDLSTGRPRDTPRLELEGSLGLGYLEVDTHRAGDWERGPFWDHDRDAPRLERPAAGTCA